jgi:hypothetical protein
MNEPYEGYNRDLAAMSGKPVGAAPDASGAGAVEIGNGVAARQSTNSATSADRLTIGGADLSDRLRQIERYRRSLPRRGWPLDQPALRRLVDTAMRLGANHPMGPLQLADFIGLDTCLAIMNVLHEGLADTKYRPCPLLVKYVEAGWLGRKTQRGFYDYRGAAPVPTR